MALPPVSRETTPAPAPIVRVPAPEAKPLGSTPAVRESVPVPVSTIAPGATVKLPLATTARGAFAVWTFARASDPDVPRNTAPAGMLVAPTVRELGVAAGSKV